MEPDENEVETTRNPKRRSRSDSDSDNGTSTLSSGNLKRQKQDHEKNSEYDKVADHARTREGTSFHNYGVGWICALPHELAAARAMLDSTHENLFQIEGDINTYTLGNIGSHNVVMACLPQKGTGMNNAAIVATHLLRSFGKIYLMLMVGIGGGIPGPHDPRLGDVVVGSEVIQYDLGKSIKDGQFQRTGILRLSNTHVRTALSKFMAEHDTHQNEIPKILRRIVERDRKMTPYATQGWAADLLFRSDCEHSSLINCESCDKLKLVPRTPRTGEQPHIHYGKIASANRVVKDATERDKLSRDLGALCIDMEAAGIMDSYPSLLSIRGLSDYSDAHKNDEWQKYAAGTAAACAKEFLSVMPCKRGLGSSPTAEVPANYSQSSVHGQRHSTPSQQSRPKLMVCNVQAGDHARQIAASSANVNIVVENVKAKNKSWQIFGSSDVVQQLAGFMPKMEDTEVEDDDSTAQVMDECVSGTARR